MVRWTVGEERVVDENRHIRLSTVDVELPDGTEFTQYVARMPACAMTLMLDDHDHGNGDAGSGDCGGRRVLLMRRHRFVIDRWVWELPGGYVDGEEDLVAAAAREAEEETGWRPRSMEHLVMFQPSVGSLDQPQHVYLARGADRVGEPDVNEAGAVQWFPLSDAVAMIEQGEIVGAATIVGIYRSLTVPA